MRTALPAKDKRLAFQPTNFCLIHSNTKFRSSLVVPQCFMGKPRYFPRFGVEQKPRISHKDSLVSTSTFGEKKTLDLLSLMDYQDLAQKSSRTSRIVEQLTWSSLANRTKTSAKNRCETATPLLELLTGIQLLDLHFSSMK